MRWLPLVLLMGCNKGSDPDGKPTGGGLGPTGAIETPFNPFEPGLNLLVGGVVVPPGGLIDLGEAPVDAVPTSTTVLFSNPGTAAVTLGAVVAGDARVSWAAAPPASIPGGGTAEAVISLDPTEQGTVAATLTVGEASWSLAGTVRSPAPLVIVGRLGRTLVSDDYGATFFSDTQEVMDPTADEWRNQANFNDVVYGAGTFVAVGGDSERRFAVSEDGLSWTNVNEGYPGRVDAVAYGMGGFLAVDDGSTLWSVDGEHWIEEAGDWRGSISSLKFGNDRFVGVGASRRVVSVDGQTLAVDADSGTGLSAMAFGNGVFVAVGQNGLVATTVDGEVWDERTLGSASRGGIAFGNGVFVVGGWPDNQWTSPDGISWTESVPNEQMPASGFANGHFFGFSWRDRIWRSPDGVTWELVQDNSSPERAGFTGIAFAESP